MATNVGDQFHPGQIVPVSGIYRCTTDTDHTFESTDVKEHRFRHCPPVARAAPGSWNEPRPTARTRSHEPE